jgi:hypothetical protein
MTTKSIVTRLDELLRPLGFTRHKALWNRKASSFVDVIDVQTSKAGDTITINAGVLQPEVHIKCWGTEPPAVIEVPSCTVRVRVGQLLDNKDLWWRLNDDGFVDDVTNKITAHVLPFLERMHSFDSMEEFLTRAQVTRQKYPLPIIYLALLKNQQGDRTAACELLSELRRKTVGAWQSRISEVARRLGCP